MFQVWDYFQNIRINDVIDILVSWIIIYRFLLVIQGSRAIQVFLGLASLGALFWLSFNYQFYTLNWLLTHFFNYFFIVIVILFQEQLRSALSEIGDFQISRRKDFSKLEQTIEEVSSACGALSREKIGALIVLEKNNSLKNMAATGTRLNSEVHSDLIYSLFQSQSPLHDGAIMIAKNRILAAGVFLPLSRNLEIDRHFGTRHRAAVGITEVSDCVVVTVSEETGRINLCLGTEFYYMENEQILRQNLRRFMTEEKQPATLQEIKA